jgi:DNA polymerase elongation subunit (family B)
LEVDLSKWNFCLFDIEVASDDSGFPFAEKAAVPINLITCYSSKHKQTFTWGLGEYTGHDSIVKNYRSFKDEYSLLVDWLKWFDKECFDLWSGWNSKTFDVPYIVNRIKNVRTSLGIEKPIENKLSPVGKSPIKCEVTDRATGSKMGETYDIPGLLHHDYMELYKTFAKHDPLPTYSLNYITHKELGEGKLEYEGTINTIYKTDWNRFVEYNIQDVLLLVRLEEKLKLFALIVEYSYDSIDYLYRVYARNDVTTDEIREYVIKEYEKSKQNTNNK